jgi:two-component system invasion response regulator UvrY
MNMVRVVIVDDHAGVREAWAMVLGQNPGLKVIAQCKNGAEAVFTARELRPDVMLMDINMEPVGGIEATRLIREFSEEIKIIGVSVQADRSYVTEMLRNGANGYVTKSSPASEMLEAIHDVINGKTFLCRDIEPTRSVSRA